MHVLITENPVCVLGVAAVLLGLASPALGRPGVPKQLENIQEQLRNVQNGVDTLQDTVGRLPELRPVLCDVPPVWGQKIAGADRFVPGLDGAAFCDGETGLVWERDPALHIQTWRAANGWCAVREVGGRKGWALPTRAQLASLVDSDNSIPALPTNHPFKGVQPQIYWTASTPAGMPGQAWYVDFASGLIGNISKGAETFAWCVRGGQTYDGQ